MDKRRWDLVIPIITIFLLLFAIILVLIKNAHDEMTKEVVTTEATTEAEIATASVATPEEAMSEQIEPAPTKEIVHCVTTETTTQATTTEEYTTEVFSVTATTEVLTTEESTEEFTEATTEEYIEEPLPPEEPQEPEPPAEPEEPAAPEGMTYLGAYTITGYTWTGDPCANGNYPTSGYSCACNSLPLGTVIYIEGIGTRVVEDRVGRSGLIVDVFVDSTSEAYAITGSYDVYIVE